MVLTLKDDNTIGSLQLCHLLYMLGVIYESVDIFTSQCLYTIMIFTDGRTIGMCLCALLAASGLVYCWMNACCIILCIYCVSI